MLTCLCLSGTSSTVTVAFLLISMTPFVPLLSHVLEPGSLCSGLCKSLAVSHLMEPSGRPAFVALMPRLTSGLGLTSSGGDSWSSRASGPTGLAGPLTGQGPGRRIAPRPEPPGIWGLRGGGGQPAWGPPHGPGRCSPPSLSRRPGSGSAQTPSTPTCAGEARRPQDPRLGRSILRRRGPGRSARAPGSNRGCSN